MLSQSESYALFKEMMQQPWVETSEDSACINYGLSYSIMAESPSGVKLKSPKCRRCW